MSKKSFEEMQEEAYQRALKIKERLDKMPRKNPNIEYDPILIASDLLHEAMLRNDDQDEEEQ